MTRRHLPTGSVIYQIYPRSFYDSNGDGVGDLGGIKAKLDYLRGGLDALNVDVIWVSPFFKSPMADGGYDIVDHCVVDPLFGTMDDFDDLLKSAHQRELKVLIDFIPNHTSDQHAWFTQSRSSHNNPKRNWYIWRDPAPGGKPPNNWISVSGQSSWTLDQTSGQYYYHSFLPEQPDLNWENTEVRQAMKNIMKFWLDKGVDGFRLDAVNWMAKNFNHGDEPLNPAFRPGVDKPYLRLQHKHTQNLPRLYDYLREVAEVLESYPETFMITEDHPEIWNKTHETWNNASEYVRFYQQILPSLSAPINMAGIFAPWDAKTFQTIVDSFQSVMEAYYVPVYNLGNHDEARLATRLGVEVAPSAAMLLLSLPGIALLYNGDELGLTNIDVPEHLVTDGFEKNNPGAGVGRDAQRSPMPWNSGEQAGFSVSNPWLPIGQENLARNAADQLADANSLLSLYRRLIKLRHDSPALRSGTYKAVNLHEELLSYYREHDEERLLVVVNFSNKHISVKKAGLQGIVVCSSVPGKDQTKIDGTINLSSLEGLILRIS